MLNNESTSVYLRALEYEDEEFLIKLRQNKDLFKYTCGNTYFISSEHSKKLVRENITNNQNQIYLIICSRENDLPVGYLSLNNIDHINKKIQWSGIVVDPQYSGNGYATQAAKLMLKYVFEELNMNKIYGDWLEENIASLKLAEKLGFQKEGLLRQHVFKENIYHNVYIYSLLKKEYCKN